MKIFDPVLFIGSLLTGIPIVHYLHMDTWGQASFMVGLSMLLNYFGKENGN